MTSQAQMSGSNLGPSTHRQKIAMVTTKGCFPKKNSAPREIFRLVENSLKPKTPCAHQGL